MHEWTIVTSFKKNFLVITYIVDVLFPCMPMYIYIHVIFTVM